MDSGGFGNYWGRIWRFYDITFRHFILNYTFRGLFPVSNNNWLVIGLKPEAISTIPPEAMQGLRAKAVAALPSSSMSALLPQQISKMSYDAATSISPMQLNSLTPSQIESLNKVLNVAMEFETTDDDSARPEEARALDTLSDTGTDSIIGRTKTKTDDDHSHSDGTAKVTTTTPPPVNGSTTTVPPESEGETAPKSSSNSNFVVGPVLIIHAITYWLITFF